MVYLAMVLLVTANKIVSYNSVRIFLLVNSVVFAWYLCILTGLVVTLSSGRWKLYVSQHNICMHINFYSLLIMLSVYQIIPCIITCINFTSIIHTTARFVIHQLVALNTSYKCQPY